MRPSSVGRRDWARHAATVPPEVAQAALDWSVHFRRARNVRGDHAVVSVPARGVEVKGPRRGLRLALKGVASSAKLPERLIE